VEAMRAGITTTDFMGLGIPCGGSPRKCAGGAPRRRARLGERPDAGHNAPNFERSAIRAG
jgi:hypothetical protein